MLRFASFVHLLLRLIFLLSVVSAPLVAALIPGRFPQWLILPACLIPVGIVWVIAAPKARCRVCGMRLLIRQLCAKHPEAPNLPLFGFHGTLALHALTRRRVRCPYCGTPNLIRSAKVHPGRPD